MLTAIARCEPQHHGSLGVNVRSVELVLALLLGLLVLAPGCAVAPPGTGMPSAPQTPWTPAAPPAPAPPSTDAAVETLPPRFVLAEAIDLALRNSPDTRAAWRDAQAAAARYGSARGAWWPTLDAEASATRADDVTGDWSTIYGAGARLSYLLFDFGGRAGGVEAAKQALAAANWTHSAAVHDRVLDVEVAFFAHAAARAILEANRASLADAESSLSAADARHELGLATIADVLQARTALSQVRLEVQTTEGRVRTSRGALALTMGYPANTPLDIVFDDAAVPAVTAAWTVDELIERAVAERPDLQAARARAWELAAEARAARADLLPSLSFGAFAGRSWIDGVNDPSDLYSAAVFLDIPLFSGFSRSYAARAAEARAEAEAERARGGERGVVYEVFVAHSDLQTATERVATSADLLASATESERVAAGRYREGVGTVLDLLSAQRALASARALEIAARLDWFMALARLAHDIGSLDPRASGILSPQE
jgi:outer membrane protein TolC